MSVLDLARDHIDGRYRLVHLGEPMPLPRPRVKIMPGRDGSHWPKFYLPAKARHRMDEIAAEWQRLHYPTLDGPLVCEASFVCSRPATHLGTGANLGVVKPRYLADRPKGADVDNLAKLCLDALQGVAFTNDDQVPAQRAAGGRAWGTSTPPRPRRGTVPAEPPAPPSFSCLGAGG